MQINQARVQTQSAPKLLGALLWLPEEVRERKTAAFLPLSMILQQERFLQSFPKPNRPNQFFDQRSKNFQVKERPKLAGEGPQSFHPLQPQ